jgi:hypothetical protein
MKRNPRYKLVMVSVWYRGKQKTIFAHVPVGDDGKVRYDYNSLAESLGARTGDTYTTG